jgi:hypothetical protein
MATQYVWTAMSCLLTFWLLSGEFRGRGLQLAVKRVGGPKGPTP